MGLSHFWGESYGQLYPTLDKVWGPRVAVLFSTLVFAVIHYDWGLTGMVQTGCMGLC